MIQILKQLILLQYLQTCGALDGKGVAASHTYHNQLSNVHGNRHSRNDNENKNNSQRLYPNLRHLSARTSSSSTDDDGENIFDTLLGNSIEHGDVNIGGSSCRPVGQCQLCPGGKRSGKNGCEATGKRQAFACLDSNANESAEDGGSSNTRKLDADADADDDDLYIDGNENLVMEIGKDRRIVYQSCSRTGADEDRIMYRFQFVCVIVAFFSLRSVRKEKMTTESLFDQRKRRASVARQQQQKQQEMAPLFTRNGDDVMSLDGTEGSDSSSAHMNMMENGDLDTSRKIVGKV